MVFLISRKAEADSESSGTKQRAQQTASFTTKKPQEYSNEPEDYEEEDEEEDYEEQEEYPVMEREGGQPQVKSSTVDDKDDTDETELPASTTTLRPRVNFKAHTLPPKAKVFNQSSPEQKQTAVVTNPDEKFKVVQTQNGRSVYHPRKSNPITTTTEAVPVGFKEIEKKEVPQSLSHKQERKEVVTTKFLPSKASAQEIEKGKMPDSFVSVTKQVTGINEDNKLQLPGIPGKNFESTYYTKSSTCGYFTFTCNIVYGANGRSKICRPKPPTNGKC